MSTIPFQLVTFDGVALRGQATSISVPTPDGEITVLPHHVPLITAVEPGEVRVTLVEEGRTALEFIAVGAGFLEVARTGVVLLTRTAEAVEAIDEARAHEAIARAQARLKELAEKKVHEDDAEIAETSALLARNIARLGVVKRRKRIR